MNIFFFVPVALFAAFCVTRVLEKNTIDRIYYTLAIVGVLGFYFAQEDRRFVQELAQERSRILSLISGAGFYLRNYPNEGADLQVGLIAEAKRLYRFIDDLYAACQFNRASVTCRWGEWFENNTEYHANLIGRLPKGPSYPQSCKGVFQFRDAFYQQSEKYLECYNASSPNDPICFSGMLSKDDELEFSLPDAQNPWDAVTEALSKLDVSMRNGLYEKGMADENLPDCSSDIGSMSIAELREVSGNAEAQIKEVRSSLKPNTFQSWIERVWPYVLIFALSLKLGSTTSIFKRGR